VEVRLAPRRLGALLTALVAAGCASAPNRPVADGPDARALAALLRRPEPPGATVSGLALVLVAGVPEVSLPAPAPAVRADRGEPVPPPRRPEAPSLEEAPAADLALGLPLRLDFGVGEAPYDDGTLPLHRGSVGRPGFSDTFLSLEWRSPVTRAVALTCRAAFVREQDTALLEGLAEARFGFLVLGCGVSF